ncbi:MAG: DUF3995 domain-containing protein [Chitinophagaceae bacterium]
MIILILINTTILTVLAAMHFYWAFGGKRFFEGSVPTYPTGQFVFRPGFLTTIFVAVMLLGFAFITVGNLSIFKNINDDRNIKYGTYGICIIFLLRSIGDFKFIGFGKKVKGTKFASNDTKFYSPLSLLISITSLVIGIVK